jgi:hypothetical protein
MKKVIAIALVLLAAACTQDSPYIETPPVATTSLSIEGVQGLKLESYIVASEVKINSKLPAAGTYKLKIYDFGGNIVSQEKIEGKEGDNILTVYISALPVSSYSIELQTVNNVLIGKEYFSIQN